MDIIESKVDLMDDKDEAAQIDSLSSDFQKLSAMSKRRDEDTESNKLNADGRAQIFDSLDLLSDNIVSKQRRPSFYSTVGKQYSHTRSCHRCSTG